MRIDFMGLPLDALTMDETVDACLDLISSGGHHQHVVLNAAKVVASQDDAVLAAAIRQCSLINADGQSIVWASRLLGNPVPERIAGIDLMARLWQVAAEENLSVYLLGATDRVLSTVVDRATRQGVRVVGSRNGYWTPEEEAAVVAEVAANSPDLLFIAMPSPRKERFLSEHLAALDARLAVGVGGSFDVVAGQTKRAPRWMQASGLEWAYRMLQEPRRMFRRYLVGNSKFLLLVANALWVRLSRRPLGRPTP